MDFGVPGLGRTESPSTLDAQGACVCSQCLIHTYCREVVFVVLVIVILNPVPHFLGINTIHLLLCPDPPPSPQTHSRSGP